MIKRTITIASPAHLSLSLRQLKISFKEGDRVATVPLEDIGYLILEQRQITLTMPLLQFCAESNICVIICDERHHPSAQLLPLQAHSLPGRRFSAQFEASKPTKKRLWQELVKQKIQNQASLLEGPAKSLLQELAKQVKSGDATNREGVAAKHYWQHIFPLPFVRDQGGTPPNDLLNYGYTILRAATLRALVGSGLQPGFSLCHSNQYNATPLADDIMEPYRPFVDRCVRFLIKSGDDYPTIDECKQDLLRVLVADVFIDGSMRPLQLALTDTTTSLALVYEGERDHLSLPLLLT